MQNERPLNTQSSAQRNGRNGDRFQTKQTSTISSSPMRKARMKDAPSLTSTNSLELLSSPSRGLELGTDASQDLTNAETQHRFRTFISERIQKYIDQHGPVQKDKSEAVFGLPQPSPDEKEFSALRLNGANKQSLQDILLFVRRLREGCVAADRIDAFTLDVYLLSSLLSLLIGDNIQLSSSLPRTVDLCELMHSSEVETELGCNALKDVNLILYGDQRKSSSGLNIDAIRSLYLLWLSISGGRAERLGGQHQQLRAGSTLTYHEHKQQLNEPMGQSVKLIERINTALGRNDLYALRRILIELQNDLESHQERLWQLALLSRTVNAFRKRVWHTLTKAYMHLAIDPALIGSQASWPQAAALVGNGEWVERMLLIDVDVMPVSKEEKEKYELARGTNVQQRPATPETWDDSVGDLTNDLQNSSLSDSSSLTTIRMHRLARAFEAFGLPPSNEDEHEGLSRWRDRIVLQAGAPVIKIR